MYPVGLIVLNCALLVASRKAILTRRPTLLSKATAFLHKEYEPWAFWWELMEMTRRLWLVGVMMLVERGTVTQLVMGTMFSLVYQLVQMQANPYLDQGDDFLANAASFSLSVVFLCCECCRLTHSRAVRARSLSLMLTDLSRLSCMRCSYHVQDHYAYRLAGGV